MALHLISLEPGIDSDHGIRDPWGDVIRTWDQRAQKQARSWAHYQWQFCPEDLWTPSTALH